MKKLFYILLAAGLFFGFTSCEDDEPVTDQPQTETPENGGEDDENGNNDPENPNPVEGDILVVYYSFTNNTHTIVTDLLTQIDADVVRVEPAEKGLDYAQCQQRHQWCRSGCQTSYPGGQFPDPEPLDPFFPDVQLSCDDR